MRTQREHRRALAEKLWGGFYRCPKTGQVIEGLHGDDKAMCRCGDTHVVRHLEQVSVDDYLDQEEARRAAE